MCLVPRLPSGNSIAGPSTAPSFALDEEMLETKVGALSTCFQTYFYQCNLFLHLRDENALNMMETLKLPNRFFALSKATVDVHQF